MSSLHSHIYKSHFLDFKNKVNGQKIDVLNIISHWFNNSINGLRHWFLLFSQQIFQMSSLQTHVYRSHFLASKNSLGMHRILILPDIQPAGYPAIFKSLIPDIRWGRIPDIRPDIRLFS